MQIPLVWRYLLRNYFQVFFLSVFAFIGVLLVLRFQEIARFATSGASFLKVSLFTILQIPYILPIAIPVSCLIAAMLLFQRLSHTHELTALRTLGFSLKTLITPLLFAGAFLSLINFTIASEISPKCRSKSKSLIFEIVSSNPLFLLQKESLVKLKSLYFDLKTLKAGQAAEDVILVIKNSSNERLALISAASLTLEGKLLKGKEVSIVSTVDSKTAGYDHLVIENQKEMNTEAMQLSQFIQTADWIGSYDYLTLKKIFAKDRIKNGYFTLSKTAQLEVVRRLSIALAAFTFTVIGLSFGMHISRNHSKRGVIYVIALASLFLVCFICAKSLKYAPWLSTLIFLLPHPVILFFSFQFMRSIQEGRE